MIEYVIAYLLVDSERESEHCFNTLQEAQYFVRSLDESLMHWVEMYVPNHHVCEEEPHEFDIIEGYSEILEYGR